MSMKQSPVTKGPDALPVRSGLDEFERRRRLGVGRMFLIARRQFVTQLRENMHEIGEPTYPAMQIAPYLDAQGTRSVDLARRMGVSKQAVARMVRELQALKMVVLVPDPTDGRATIVKFTAKGMRYISKMRQVIDQIEQQYRRDLGDERYAVFRECLSEIAYGSVSGDTRTGARQ